MTRTAVLLLAFGGPESIDQIGPFVTKLMGRPPAPPILERSIARYRTIGGGSPLPRLVREQAAALGQALASAGELAVLPAFKYTEPTITTTIANLTDQGFSRIVGLSLSPHYSSISTGAYFDELREAAKGRDLEVFTVDGFHAQPAFVEAIVEKAKLALSALESLGGDEPALVFTAHSLPVEYLEKGDPYVEQLNETITGIVEMMPDRRWHLAYQSRGHGAGQWLEPDIEKKLEDLAAEGVRQVVIVPLSFTCDHIETLYDIDIAVAEKARALGLGFARAEALNTSKRFIEALATAVRPYLAPAEQG